MNKTGTHINSAPPLPINIYIRRPLRKLPFPLDEPNCRIFSKARHGLFFGIKALDLKPQDEILAPAYHHGSEIEALIQAGMVCRFYDVGQRLEPKEEELEALLNPRVRALHLTHFLGLPQNAAYWRAWCDERGLLLIEDAAQAWLSSRDGIPVGSHGDLSIFCLYKTFGLPDGAAVVCSPPVDVPHDRHSLGIVSCVQKHSLYLVQQSGWFAGLRRRLKRARQQRPQRDLLLGDHDFALGAPTRAPDMSTSLLLTRVVDLAAQKARAAHYAFLLERLRHLVPEPFAHLPEGASPLAFLIRSGQKKEMLNWLHQSGIMAASFWTVPHASLETSGFPQATALRDGMIALPVHQELGIDELERIAGAVLSGPE